MRNTYTKSILCIASLILCINLHAQNCWSPLGSGAAGYVSVMTTYKGNLIVGGNFYGIDTISANNIASWDGSSWSPMSLGIILSNSNSNPCYISSLVVYNGELYAAGQFNKAGGILVNNIAKWNDTSWSDVGGGISGTSYTVQALTVYNGALYAAGRFDLAGGVHVNHIAKWDGSQWSDVGGGIRTYNVNNIYTMTSHNGLLFVGGTFDSAGGVAANNVARWNDSIWAPLGTGIGNYNTQVTSIAFNNEILYAAILDANYSSNNPYTDSLAAWDGNAWSYRVGVTATNNNIGIDALLSFNGNLIVAGGFDSIGGITGNSLAQWNGINWSEFGGGLDGDPDPQGNTLCTYNGNLYVGGDFTKAGSDYINSIAEYTCATNGIHEVSANHVHLYPNPTTGIVNISIDALQPGYSVTIYDLLGQRIAQSAMTTTTTEMNLSGHAPGTYLYRISGGGGENISAGVFIIE